VIEAQNIAKRYGEKVAVGDLSFTVKPGIVTGFLGLVGLQDVVRKRAGTFSPGRGLRRTSATQPRRC
jgi:ABC-2 type transport system ATP-binding protein